VAEEHPRGKKSGLKQKMFKKNECCKLSELQKNAFNKLNRRQVREFSAFVCHEKK
jgi:hypothetical protein